MLETGHTPLDLFADAPEMDCFRAWPGTFPRGSWGKDISTLSRAFRALQPGKFDLAVIDLREFCFLRRHASLADGLFRLLKYSFRSPRELGHLLLFRKILQLGLPIAWINRTDRGGVPDGSAWFFDRCHAAFIRELHPDPRMSVLSLNDTPGFSRRWTGFPQHSDSSFLWNKLYPISLGLAKSEDFPPVSGHDREWDVLFGYGPDSHDKPLRDRLLAELQTCAPRLQIKLRIVDRLPRKDWIEALNHSSLCFSPPGVGWDCWRHYESMAAGCIPLLTYPTILRHQPPVEGEHAFYFASEPGGLTKALQNALALRHSWPSMAEASRRWVAEHHRWPQLRSYVVQTTLTSKSSPKIRDAKKA